MSRDVLAPTLQQMSSNRCYRINQIHDYFGGNKWSGSSNPQATGYIEQDLYTDVDCDAEDEDDCNIEKLPNSNFQLSLNIAKAFYGGLIGFKGATKQRIETETKTELFVPRSTDKSNNIIIKGKTRSSLCAAKRKICLLIESLRKRMQPTHFLAVALNTGDVKQKFIELKNQVLKAQLPGINEDLFINERCIHLTLLVCVLLNETERSKAAELLQECRAYLRDITTPISIEIRGLEIMNDDPSATRVVYARVESTDLKQFANRCCDHFAQSGLTFLERDDVKLHMTVLNNRYREQKTEKSDKNFDARELLKRFGHYHFGTIKCSEVHLCVLNSSKEVEDFYKISSTLKFE